MSGYFWVCMMGGLFGMEETALILLFIGAMFGWLT